MKKMLLMAVICMLLLVCTGCGCEHVYGEATCTEPPVCTLCGKAQKDGAALGHSWQDATCAAPKTCQECGTTEGEKKSLHTWEEADCTNPDTCSLCGTTKGAALGHKWSNATCLKPKTCSTCGATEGPAAGHSWQAATCAAPRTCSGCGLTEGAALAHTWTEADCSHAQQCTACKATEGKALGHAYEKNVCTRCGDKMIETLQELRTYLNKNFSKLETPLATINGINFEIIDHNPPLNRAYDFEIRALSSLFVTETEHALASMVCSDYYAYEDRVGTMVALVEYQRQVAQVAMDAFPEKKITGYFFDYGYKYPSLGVGYNSESYFYWTNFDGPALSASYSKTTLGEWRINEFLGDAFIGDYFFCADGEKLMADVIKQTGYNISFQYD